MDRRRRVEIWESSSAWSRSGAVRCKGAAWHCTDRPGCAATGDASGSTMAAPLDRGPRSGESGARGRVTACSTTTAPHLLQGDPGEIGGRSPLTDRRTRVPLCHKSRSARPLCQKLGRTACVVSRRSRPSVPRPAPGGPPGRPAPSGAAGRDARRRRRRRAPPSAPPASTRTSAPRSTTTSGSSTCDPSYTRGSRRTMPQRDPAGRTTTSSSPSRRSAAGAMRMPLP